VIKAKWGPGAKFFTRNRAKIFKKDRHLSDMDIFHKKVFTFYVGLLVQRSLEVSSGCMLSASSNSPLIKRREAYCYYFSVLVFPLLQKIFLPTPLGTQRLRINNKKQQLSMKIIKK